MGTDFGAAVRGVADAFGAGVFPLFLTPARDLTAAEAVKTLEYLDSKGELSLAEPVKPGTQGKVKVRTTLGGVSFRKADPNNGASRVGSAGSSEVPFFEPTPAFAMALYRLAVRLRENWGATEIVWGGVGAGSGKHTLDCHMIGSCVDFYGATTRFGVFDVKRDWYLRPVLNKDGKRHAMVADSDDRWGNDTHTSYRLLALDDQRDPFDPHPPNSQARDFFLDVWAFVHEHCTVGKLDISPEGMRGGGAFQAGHTIHPDYPTLLRRSHGDHMHFEIGNAILKP